MTNITSYKFSHGLDPAGAPHMGHTIRPALEDPEPTMPGILAIVTALYLTSTTLLSSAERYAVPWLPQLIATGVLPAWLVFGLARRRPLILSKPIMLYVAWTVWACTGLLLPGTGHLYQSHLITLSKVVAITWLCSQCVRTRSDLLFCLLALGMGAIVIFIDGVDVILRSATYRGESETGRVSVGATLIGNANSLAIAGVMLLFGSLTCFLAGRRLLIRILALAPIPFALYIIAASGSRTGMIGLILGGVGSYWFHFRRTKGAQLTRKLAMTLMGLLVLSGTVYFVLNSPFFFRLAKTFSSKEEMLKQPRLIYTLSALGATANHPIVGLGLGGFATHGLSGIRGHYSHSTLAEVAVCTGIPGFLIYFGGQLAFFLLLYRVRKAALPQRDKTVVNLIMALFFVLQFFNVVAVNYEERLLWPLTGAICGYLEYLRRRYVQTPAHPQAAPLP